VRDMRIRVIDVLDLLANGLTPQQVLEELPDLEPEDIQACLQFASRLTNHPVIEAIVLLLDNKGRAIASGVAFLASAFVSAVGLKLAKEPCIDPYFSPRVGCMTRGDPHLGFLDYIIIVAVAFIAMAAVWSVTGKFRSRVSRAGR